MTGLGVCYVDQAGLELSQRSEWYHTQLFFFLKLGLSPLFQLDCIAGTLLEPAHLYHHPAILQLQMCDSTPSSSVVAGNRTQDLNSKHSTPWAISQFWGWALVRWWHGSSTVARAPPTYQLHVHTQSSQQGVLPCASCRLKNCSYVSSVTHMRTCVDLNSQSKPWILLSNIDHIN